MTKRLKIQGYVEIPAYMSAEDFYGEINGVPMFFNDHDLDTFKLHLEAEEPAADVVEVVRCEKCKFADMLLDIIGDPRLFCAERDFREVDFDDFCSHGKRREK